VKDQGAASEGTREMKPIDVEYPEPFFGGTPMDYWGPNLEPQDYRDPRTIANEKYLPIVENVFLNVMNNPLSTFSIDVDTGAYSNVRRFLNQGQMPDPNAVRIEEMINYFKYDLAQPTGEAPFSVTIEMADCPWAQGHKLARVALQGRTVVSEERNPANLVFLIDVSGSMSNANKLPLAKEAMKALLNELEPRDRVAIVTYASGVSVPLNSTPCTEKDIIRNAIDSLGAGGSTNGSGGIQQAYQIARSNFISGGINRVLLATDGDFNVGTTSHDALMNLITTEAKSKVFLTVMGFGYGNIKDGTLEQIADKGNGNYAYIDNYAEARRVLVDQISGTLVTIAKDVKIQVEFNPQHIQAYRLIGYENRALEDRDFNDDTKDAGEIGAGHQVTALYQLVPRGANVDPGVDQLRYQNKPEPEAVADGPVNPEWMTVKLRYKEPDGDTSKLIELPCTNIGGAITQATQDMQFVASVAAFGMMLRHSQHQGTASYDRVIALAESGKKGDPERQACIDLMVTAKTLAATGQAPARVFRYRQDQYLPAR
jgi:Ca-activated chloride channel homolog